MVHDLNLKNLHINELFFAKSKKNLFLGVLVHYPQIEIFPQKFGCQFFTLKVVWLYEKFQKNHMSRFVENVFTYWHTDILTVVKP